MTSAAERWDQAYAEVAEPGSPADFVVERAHLLPTAGSAADLAGGTGGTALWLADRGYDTTLVEVSARAIDVARCAATDRGLALSTLLHDLERDGAPAGTWDVVVVSNFLHRPLLAKLHGLLNPGGLAFVCLATTRNLERHQRPSARFLIEEDELVQLCGGLDVVDFEQEWFGDRREARLVGRLSEPR
ncbi:MAG: class I SAM-dependent methyltransferase [Actinomycetota bacterium]|nr:class I SAM-dependent methyltransferase [Actinomycetota bacterium]